MLKYDVMKQQTVPEGCPQVCQEAYQGESAAWSAREVCVVVRLRGERATSGPAWSKAKRQTPPGGHIPGAVISHSSSLGGLRGLWQRWAQQRWPNGHVFTTYNAWLCDEAAQAIGAMSRDCLSRVTHSTQLCQCMSMIWGFTCLLCCRGRRAGFQTQRVTQPGRHRPR